MTASTLVAPLRARIATLTAPGRRGVTAAVIVAFALRLAWVLWVTVEPGEATSDSAQILAMARQFADGDTYRLNGHFSAFHPPGYSLLLAPLAWVSEHVGGFSLPLGAALVNVIAGTASVAFVAILAGRWLGPRERTVAAWLLALAPGQIFLTSAALAETVFTALVLAALILVTGLVRSAAPPSRALLAGLGALLGYLTLVRSPGALVLLVAIVALWRARGSLRAAAPAIGILVLAFVVLLVPWTVRNGVQVGTWTPTNTGNAAFLCQGHRDDAVIVTTDLTREDFLPCFTGTPFAPDPDEAAWYPRTVREAVRWAVTHPGEEVRLTWEKTLRLLSDDRQSLVDGQDFGRQETVGPTAERRLQDLNDLWYRSVLVLGALGAVLVARGRAAWPLWATAVGLLVIVWGGVPLDRFHHTVMAILTVFAAGTLVAMGRWASAGVRTSGGATEAELDAEAAPPPPSEGLAQASRSGSRLAGPAGHPFLPVLLGVATGAWVCSVGFDVISFASSTEWVYARGAWLLTGMGVAAGLVATFAALADLLGIPRATPAFQAGVRYLLALDAAVVLFAASFLIRNGSDFHFHDPSPVSAVVLSVLGLVALAMTHWLGGTLTYAYGVRVALDDERQKGFEPLSD